MADSLNSPEKLKPSFSIPSGIEKEDYNQFLIDHFNREYTDFVSYIIHQLDVDYHANILDIGARIGWLSFELSKRLPDATILGLVFSEEMLTLANQNKERLKVSNVRFRKASENKLDQFSNKSFDVVISHKVLHLFNHPQHMLNCVKKMLAPDGKYAISDYRSDLKLLAKAALWYNGTSMKPEFRKYWKNAIQNSFTLDEVVKLLLKTKLKDWKIQSTLVDYIIHN